MTCHRLKLIVNSTPVSTDMEASTIYVPALPKTSWIHPSFTKWHHKYTICYIFDSLSNLFFQYSYLMAVTANVMLLLCKQKSFINLAIHLIKNRLYTSGGVYWSAQDSFLFTHCCINWSGHLSRCLEVKYPRKQGLKSCQVLKYLDM